MDEIKELLKSPVFWFATVAVAFAMSYLAAATRDWVAKIRARFSAKQKERNASRAAHIQELGEMLGKDRYAQVLYRVEMLQFKLRHVLYLVVSYVFAAFGLFLGITGLPLQGTIMLGFSVFVFLVMGQPISRRLSFMSSVFEASLKGRPIEELIAATPADAKPTAG